MAADLGGQSSEVREACEEKDKVAEALSWVRALGSRDRESHNISYEATGGHSKGLWN